MGIRRFFSQFSFKRNGQQETFYSISREGRLVLDLEGLLKSGRMKRQLDAARQLRDLKIAADKARVPK
jgi:hypothetical protein